MRKAALALLTLTLPLVAPLAQQRVMSPAAVLTLPTDASRMIRSGEVKRAELRATDDMLSDSTYIGRWLFEGKRGQRATVTHRSSAFDAFLIVGRQGADEPAEQNDDAEETNSEIAYTLPEDGVYVIIASSYAPKETGEYNLSLVLADPEPGMSGPITPVTVLQRAADPMQRVGLDRRMGSQLDARDAKMDDSTHFELWYFSADAGDEITVTLESTQFAGSVFVGALRGHQTEGGAGPARSRVDFTAQASGTFVIVIKGNTAADRGSYIMDIARKPRTP